MVLWSISIAVGMTVAALCIPLNQLLAKMVSRAVVWLLPLVEEMAKTTAALLIQGTVPLVHLGFGLAELTYDVIWLRGSIGPGALVTVLGHLVLGLVTLIIYRAFGSWAAAVGAAVTLHVIWNWLVWRVSNQ